MLKTIGWLIKLSIFAGIILVAGNLLKWKGRTVSDQVKTQLSHAERSGWTNKVKTWTANVTEDAKDGASKAALTYGSSRRAALLKNRVDEKVEVDHAPSRPVAQQENNKEDESAVAAPKEKIPSSERQKLRALIRELNTPSSSAHLN